MSNRVTVLAILCILFVHTQATVYNVSTSVDLWSKVSLLEAGDELMLLGGTYTTQNGAGGSFYRKLTLRGNAGAMIKIYGAPNEKVTIEGDKQKSQNILDLDLENVSIANIKFMYGSRGLRLLHGKNCIFEDITITMTASSAFTANDNGQTYESLTLRRMEIYNVLSGTGECFYLGCNEAACNVINSVIENNYCHDQMKTIYGSITLKSGSYGNVIRDNVVHNTPNPGIFAYSTYYNSAGAAAASGKPNIIEGNIVWSTADNGIQVTGNAIIRNNIVMSAGSSGIAVQANQGTVENVRIVHNTVVVSGASCIYLPNAPGLIVANNALYCNSALSAPNGLPSGAIVLNNVIQGTSNVNRPNATLNIGDRSNDFVTTSSLPYNLYPTGNSALLGNAHSSYIVDYDFNGDPRPAQNADVGAYQRDGATNPGWIPSKNFKSVQNTDEGEVSGATATHNHIFLVLVAALLMLVVL